MKTQTPKYRGVSWHRGRGHQKYRAKITAGISVHLGDYDDPERAALVYDAAERLVRGPDANLNFPRIPSSLADSAYVIGRLKAVGAKY